MVLIVAAALAWFTWAVVLARVMARRGCVPTAWPVVALVFGPIATAFASFEIFRGVQRSDEIVEPGRPAQRAADLLVVLTGEDHQVACVAGAGTWRPHRPTGSRSSALLKRTGGPGAPGGGDATVRA